MRARGEVVCNDCTGEAVSVYAMCVCVKREKELKFHITRAERQTN